MVKFQFSKSNLKAKNKSAEQISQKVFRLMIGLAVLVFGLFYLIGYDLPFDENPDFNAPLFTDVLIFLMWLFLIGGVGLAVYSMVKDYRSSKSETVVNGVPYLPYHLAYLAGCSDSYLPLGRFRSDAHQWRELRRLVVAETF